MPPGSNRIHYQKTLRDIASSMVRLKKPERLLKLITRFIDAKFGLTHTSLLVLDEKKKCFTFADSKGSRRMPIGLVKVDSDHALVTWFDHKRVSKKRGHDHLDRWRLEKLAAKAPDQAAQELRKILRGMDDFKAQLAVPAYYKRNLIGLLLLGRHTDGRMFRRSEIDFFHVLAQDCAMAVKSAEHQRSLLEQNLELARRLHEIEQLQKKERETYYQIMRSLAQEVHAKDPYTFGHVHQVERLGLLTAREMDMDLSDKKKDILSAGLILHDVGKIGIPDRILKKEGQLDEEEWKIMRTHVEKGAKILEHLVDFREVAEIVLSHHENYDGSGYPRGLKGEEIPLEARIVAVVDAFHAIVSTRCYSKGRPVETAFEELRKFAGKQFDPAVVEAFLRALKREMKKRGVGFFLEDAAEGSEAA